MRKSEVCRQVSVIGPIGFKGTWFSGERMVEGSNVEGVDRRHQIVWAHHVHGGLTGFAKQSLLFG